MQPDPIRHFPVQARDAADPAYSMAPIGTPSALQWLATTVVALTGTVFLLARWTGGSSWSGIAATLSAMGGGLWAVVAVRYGAPRAAALGIVIGVWGAGAAMVLGAGTSTPAAAVFMVALVLAAMVDGSRLVGATAAMSLAVSLGAHLWTPEGLDPEARAVMSSRRFFIELELFGAIALMALWWTLRAEAAATTRQRLIERELIAEPLRLAVEASRSGVALSDEYGRVTYVNQSLVEMWRLPGPSEAIGRNVMAFWADPESARAVMTRLAHGQNLVADLRGRRHDGTEFDVEFSGTRVLLHETGREAFIGSFVDVTERLAAERRLAEERERTRAIVDYALDIVIILDHGGRVLYENAAVERILGYPRGERLGHNILEYAHPDDIPEAGERLAALSAPGDISVGVTLRFRHRDGSWRWLETLGRNLSDVPAIGGILGVGRDVTNQREMQARLDATDRLETVGRLAGGLAHDFNNLLTAMLGNAELAQSTTASSETLRHLDGIVRAGEHARDLTRKLLGFARLEHSQPVVADIRDRLKGAEPLVRRLIGEDITVVTLPGEDALPVLLDPVQFEQILLNLAVNARDAMPQGGTFTISVHRVADAALEAGYLGSVMTGSAVRLRLRDTGTGMSPAVAARAFEPFFTTKGIGRGTGLGLSTVYGSVVHANGAVRVTSTPGAGTIFDILFPLATLPLSASTTAPTLAGPRLMSASVAVIEDDRAVRSLIEETFRDAGCEVLLAANGAEGRRLIAQHHARIDLLITDVVMPDVRGPVLATEFRNLAPGKPVIFITGYSPEALEGQAHTLGARILYKPFRLTQLLDQATQLLADAPPRQ
jgi:PAS domain S-box-containing protein